MKSSTVRLACILLAAGEARRFGGRKLEAVLGGKMLGLHAADTLAKIGFTRRVAVCNPDNQRLNRKLEAQGFTLVPNAEPKSGQSHSIALGIEALERTDAEGALIALADMPFIEAAHYGELLHAFEERGRQKIICSSNGAARMPPAIFPSSLWPELRAFTGDQGARALLRHAIAVEGDPEMLADIDRPEDLLP